MRGMQRGVRAQGMGSYTVKGREMNCEWTYDADENLWEGSCGFQWWAFDMGFGPLDANWEYCPHCGKKIEVDK
jgi:hypothetical protein